MNEFKGIKHNPPKVNLFFNWYENAERQSEIDQCLTLNRKLFDNVILIPDRPTFTQMFERSKDYPDDINCFCNSDVFFKDLTHLHTIKPNECFAITRDDLVKSNYASCSQDAWIFRGVIKHIDAPFPLGFWGSDNRLAYEIKKAGYEVKNPCLSIRIIHLHKVDNRNQKRTKDNTVPPPYHLIPPTK